MWHCASGIGRYDPGIRDNFDSGISSGGRERFDKRLAQKYIGSRFARQDTLLHHPALRITMAGALE